MTTQLRRYLGIIVVGVVTIPVALVVRHHILHPADAQNHEWQKSSALSPTNPPAPTAPTTESNEDLYLDHSTFSEVEDHLYVGGRVRIPPPDTQAVLSLSYNEDTYKVPFHRYSSIPDGGEAPSVDWLKNQVAFVAAQEKAGRTTYIHCDAGISRGPMVTAAYLMYEHHWTRDQALDFLKQKRPQISPNINFMDLLLDYEDALKEPASTPKTAPTKNPP